MESFTKNQQEMREKFAEAFGGKFGFKDFEKMTRQNIEMFERAMRMFSPFGVHGRWGWASRCPIRCTPSRRRLGRQWQWRARAAGSTQRDQEIRDLKDQLAAMRQQIADLAQRK